jgi:hypothetical protein
MTPNVLDNILIPALFQEKHPDGFNPDITGIKPFANVYLNAENKLISDSSGRLPDGCPEVLKNIMEAFGETAINAKNPSGNIRGAFANGNFPDIGIVIEKQENMQSVSPPGTITTEGSNGFLPDKKMGVMREFASLKTASETARYVRHFVQQNQASFTDMDDGVGTLLGNENVLTMLNSENQVDMIGSANVNEMTEEIDSSNAHQIPGSPVNTVTLDVTDSNTVTRPESEYQEYNPLKNDCDYSNDGKRFILTGDHRSTGVLQFQFITAEPGSAYSGIEVTITGIQKDKNASDVFEDIMAFSGPAPLGGDSPEIDENRKMATFHVMDPMELVRQILLPATVVDTGIQGRGNSSIVTAPGSISSSVIPDGTEIYVTALSVDNSKIADVTSIALADEPIVIPVIATGEGVSVPKSLQTAAGESNSAFGNPTLTMAATGIKTLISIIRSSGMAETKAGIAREMAITFTTHSETSRGAGTVTKVPDPVLSPVISEGQVLASEKTEAITVTRSGEMPVLAKDGYLGSPNAIPNSITVTVSEADNAAAPVIPNDSTVHPADEFSGNRGQTGDSAPSGQFADSGKKPSDGTPAKIQIHRVDSGIDDFQPLDEKPTPDMASPVPAKGEVKAAKNPGAAVHEENDHNRMQTPNMVSQVPGKGETKVAMSPGAEIQEETVHDPMHSPNMASSVPGKGEVKVAIDPGAMIQEKTVQDRIDPPNRVAQMQGKEELKVRDNPQAVIRERTVDPVNNNSGSGNPDVRRARPEMENNLQRLAPRVMTPAQDNASVYPLEETETENNNPVQPARVGQIPGDRPESPEIRQSSLETIVPAGSEVSRYALNPSNPSNIRRPVSLEMTLPEHSPEFAANIRPNRRFGIKDRTDGAVEGLSGLSENDSGTVLIKENSGTRIQNETRPQQDSEGAKRFFQDMLPGDLQQAGQNSSFRSSKSRHQPVTPENGDVKTEPPLHSQYNPQPEKAARILSLMEEIETAAVQNITDEKVLPPETGNPESHNGTKEVSDAANEISRAVNKTEDIRPERSDDTRQIFEKSVVDQVIKKAAYEIKDGKSEIRIDIEPENLGPLKVSVSSDNGRIIVRIMAESQMVREILEQNVLQVKNELNQQGLDVRDVTVSVDQEGKDNPWQQSAEDERKTKSAYRNGNPSDKNEGNDETGQRRYRRNTEKNVDYYA